VINRISHQGKFNLAPGGLGGIIGDGKLPSGGPGQILETCYRVAVTCFAQFDFDYQFIKIPLAPPSAVRSRSSPYSCNGNTERQIAQRNQRRASARPLARLADMRVQMPVTTSAVRVTRRLEVDRHSNQLAVAHPPLGDDALGKVTHLADRATQHRDL
jgi:hypothetical protein